MSKQTIGIGASANDDSGDPIRTAFGKVNSNFTELYDALAQHDWKASCRAASTANVTIASGLENGDTLDGVTLATGDRVLLKNQSTASQNGIYIVAASGAASRADDAADDGDLTAGSTVYVESGTVNAGLLWTLTTTGTITIGSTNQTWAQKLQPFHAILALLAALSIGANKIPRFTGASSADTIDFLDEDNLESNSDTGVPSQQSVKAYVDGRTSDADKGDITTSASFATWTIDAGAVTYAKIQNVSATDRILGRSSSGAGSIEEIVCTAAGRALIAGADNTAQRTTLGLGSMATQAADSVAITGGSVTGITDLALADGGTGASTAPAARTNLGFTKGSDIASGTTVDLSTATGDMIDVTGNTTITGLGTVTAGLEFHLRFTGAPQITHNGTSLILPGAANIQAAAGDTMIVRSLGSGNWVCIAFNANDYRTRDLCWTLPSDTADTFILRLKAAKAFTVIEATYKTTASTVTANITIDGVSVTSLSALAATTSEQTTSASGANAAAAGTDLAVALTNPGTSGSRLILTIKILERA